MSASTADTFLISKFDKIHNVDMLFRIIPPVLISSQHHDKQVPVLSISPSEPCINVSTISRDFCEEARTLPNQYLASTNLVTISEKILARLTPQP